MRDKKLVISLSLFVLSLALPACSLFGSNTKVAVNVNADANTNASAIGTPAAGGGESQSAEAEALVADLYKQHDAKKSPFFQTKSRALVDKYFTKPLADHIWKDATDSAGEVGALDADPLYDAQDTQIKNFAVGRADVKGETANVPVTFTNFGEKKSLNFALKRAGDAWKIDNIKYSANHDLLRWLKSAEVNDNQTTTSPAGEFEGRYQVGDTTCTVKPLKMAFEVRWAKGSGVEMFFFQEGTTFESSPGKGATNAFVFDDENYNSGTFYRADGKEFPVRRVGE
jgi:hypothetical protein